MQSTAQRTARDDLESSWTPLEADEVATLAALFGRAERAAKDVLAAMDATALTKPRVAFSWNAPNPQGTGQGAPVDGAGGTGAASMQPQEALVHARGPWAHKVTIPFGPSPGQAVYSAHAWLSAQDVWRAQIPRVQEEIEPFLDALQARMPVLHAPQGRLFFYAARAQDPDAPHVVGLRIHEHWLEHVGQGVSTGLRRAPIGVMDVLRLVERGRHLPPATQVFRIPQKTGGFHAARGATEQAAVLLQKICEGDV